MERSDVALEARIAQLVSELEEARGQQAAFAASKAWLESELEARTRELTATGDVLKVISGSAFDLQTVLDILTESAARLCGADTAIIRRREGDAYPVAATYGLTAKQREHFAIYSTSPNRESVFGRAVMECRTIHVPDVLADPEYNRPQIQDFVPIRAMLGVPLMRDGVPVGVLTLQRREPQPYNQQQIDLVTTFADQAVIAIENVRLFKEVQARTEEVTEALQQQTATADVLKVISRSTFDLQQVLDVLVETAARLCEAEKAFIFRFDGTVLRSAASHNASAELLDFVEQNPISPGRHSGTARAALERRTVHIPDVLADPEYSYGAKEVDSIRTVLGVPMLKNDELVGVFMIYRLEVKPFTRKQIELVETFADQAVIAIHNLRLFEEVQARTRELSVALEQQTATSEVLKVISRSAFNLQPVLDTLVETAGQLCEADQAMVFRYDGTSYRLAAHHGYSQEFTDFLEQHPITAGRGTAVGRTALEGRTVHIPDVLADPEYTFFEAQRLGGWRASLAVPLLREGKAIGAFSLNRSAPQAFTEKQIELVTTFADQAVIAIENVRLFEEVQARTSELTESLEYQTATSDVLNVISRSPSELQPVLDAIVQTAAELCTAEYASIFKCTDERCQLAAGSRMDAEHVKYLASNPVVIDRGSVTGRVALQRRIIHVPDVLADPEFKQLEWQRIGQQRTVLGVPLLREGALVGVMILARKAVEPFTGKQIDLVATFADQAVIAIENVRLFEEVQARTRELTESLEYQTATSEVLNVISRSPNDLQPVLDTIVETAHELCQAQYSLFFKLGADGLYHIAAGKDADPGFIEWLRENPITEGDGSAAGLAALQKQVLHLEDSLSDPRFTDLRRQRRSKARTMLAVPLMRSGVVIGVIFLARIEVKPFTERQVNLVTTFADQAVIAINNVGLFDEVQARTRELSESLEYQTATSEVLNVISRAPSQLQPVFDVIVETAARLCEADYAVVHQLRNGSYYVAAANNTEAEYIKYLVEHPMSPERGSVVGRTALERRTVHLPDCLADPEYTGLGYQRTGGFRTILGVPLLRDGITIGVITLLRNAVRPFTEKQIELVTTFADQAVIAIENVRLFEEVQARTTELTEALEQQTATSEVLQVISRSAFDLQPMLDTLVQSAARLSDADTGTITRQREGVFFREAIYGFSPEFSEYVRAIPVQPERGNISGRALLEGRIVQIDDVEKDPEYTWDQGKTLGHFRTLLGVPLMRQGKPVGVMSLGRRAVRPFTEKQIELVETFADQAVIAIENVRLFDEVQARTGELARSVEELRALGEVSHAVNSTLDLETVLNTIVAKAVQLSATDAGAIYVFSNLRQKFRLRATYGMSAELIEAIGQQSIGLGESYIGGATQRREALQVPDLADEPPSSVRDIILHAGYRGLLVVPLLRPNRIVGALVVRRKEPGLFPGSTIDLLQTFAAQSVLAIQNARLFEDVEARTRELANSLEELRAAQDRLVQTEKLASLGQLTAGIAHEIKNPLNFVNNFAALSLELVDELKDVLQSVTLTEQSKEQIAELTGLLCGNLDKVVQHGKRADSIVKNMLLHSRAGSGEHRLADINAIVEESLNLAYHGARAEKQGFNITLKRSLDPAAGEIDLFPQEITRVLLNLISNGFYASMKRKDEGNGGAYEPTLLAGTRNLGDSVEIRIRDNGTGVPPEVKAKMFSPFFTTKPAGEGTGLGLSLSHDIIVKQHAGSIEVDTQPGEFTEFKIVLPRTAASRAKAGAGG